MNNIIRKISIGADYKNEAMHYSVKQTVYGGHEISHIMFEESDNSYNIFIKKVDEGRSLILTWQYPLSMTWNINEEHIRFYH